MPRAIRRCWVLSGVALCAVLGGPVAAAQASDSQIVATLNSYSQTIKNDENAVKKGLIGYPQGHVKALVRALNHEVADLHALKSKLAKESPSSARGAQAKKDIIRGLGLIAKAYGALRVDVQAAHGGAVPVSQVQAAQKIDRKGRSKLLAGLKLLA